MKKLKKMKKNQKGFTLVEVIVVLVIIAILAAIMIPSLTGYIDKANQRAVVAEARSALIAIQTLASEERASFDKTDDSDDIKAAKSLAEVPGNITAITLDGTYKVTSFTYTNEEDQVKYDSLKKGDEKFPVSKTPAAPSS